MKQLLSLFTVLLLLAALTGCSDDKNGVAPPDTSPENTETSTWNAANGYWVSNVDASSYTDFTPFSFTTKDTVGSGIPKPMADVWDIAFRRDIVKLNGGSSTTNGGDAVGADLGLLEFDAVTIMDTVGATWLADEIGYFIDDWFIYHGPPTHLTTYNRNVYSMMDASGVHYVKFQIDSVVGGGAPPSMGTVYMKYFYQSMENSKDLSGPAVEVSFEAGSTPVYFDFSSGELVVPTDPANSLDWDLRFFSYEIAQNSGPAGNGGCAAFLAYTELDDPADLDAFTMQPDAPMFPDNESSALVNWYEYQGPPTHQLLSHDHVYLIKTGDKVYKLRIESYYKNIDGQATSGYYSFIWKEL